MNNVSPKSGMRNTGMLKKLLLQQRSFILVKRAGHSSLYTVVKSMNHFIKSDEYLGGLEIIFEGNLYQFEENRAEKLHVVMSLLDEVEAEVRSTITKTKMFLEKIFLPYCMNK